ncbi:MAG: helix-turn-helix transcriptional regulator [Ruminococcus sp.]|nr:helix-turn-helix transcriptional regulator [Ruminococcus sp.]
MAFIDNLERLCYENGESLPSVAQAIGMSKSVVTFWKNGSVPRNSTLRKIADHFGVTVDYLLSNESVTPSPWASRKETIDYGVLSPSEKMIIDMWRSLDHEGQSAMFRAILHRHGIEICRMSGMPNPYADESPVGGK